jgi:predicted molibdopterin-dependent oxidoreductase YjgC
VLYAVGALPFLNGDAAEFTIYQNIYKNNTTTGPVLVLPSAAFAEIDGTFTNAEGRVQSVNKAVEPPEKALPGWIIFTRIAQLMNSSGFRYKNTNDVRHEIGSLGESMRPFKKLSRRPNQWNGYGKLDMPKASSKLGKEKEWQLYAYPDENLYQGYPLIKWVDGLQMLFSDQHIDLHPEDANKLGLNDEDHIQMRSESCELERFVYLNKSQPQGTIGMLRRLDELTSSASELPLSVTIGKKDV